jgi:biopolymer transport protein ExbB/TolQ
MIIMFINLPQILQKAIYLVSTSLLYPVIVILLGLTALLVVEIGMFSFEWLARTAHFRKRELKDLEREVLEAKRLIDTGEFEGGINMLEDCTSKRFVYAFLDGLLVLNDKNTKLNNPRPVLEGIFSINLEKLLQKLEMMISKRLERTKVMVRLGPMFGLMGTLIPMGPALLALTKGDVNTLATNLIIAFGTTVVGLLVGGVSYLIFTIRTRWYKQDMNDIDYLCEVLFGGGE